MPTGDPPTQSRQQTQPLPVRAEPVTLDYDDGRPSVEVSPLHRGVQVILRNPRPRAGDLIVSASLLLTVLVFVAGVGVLWWFGALLRGHLLFLAAVTAVATLFAWPMVAMYLRVKRERQLVLRLVDDEVEASLKARMGRWRRSWKLDEIDTIEAEPDLFLKRSGDAQLNVWLLPSGFETLASELLDDDDARSRVVLPVHLPRDLAEQAAGALRDALGIDEHPADATRARLDVRS